MICGFLESVVRGEAILKKISMMRPTCKEGRIEMCGYLFPKAEKLRNVKTLA